MIAKIKYCIDCNKKIDKRATRCPECYYNWRTGINNPNYKHGKWIHNFCPDCHKKIDARAKRCRSCSTKYRWQHDKTLINRNQQGKRNPMYGIHRFGKQNPNWLGGIQNLPYAFEFNDKLKFKIRKRDNFKCQNCNMTEKEHKKIIGYSLCIHHINYNKLNCKEDNLITLCNQCNVRANYNRKYWLKYYKDKLKCYKK